MKRRDPALQIIKVSKIYEIHHEKPTLMEHILKRRRETFQALRNVTLTVERGEKVGIIGPNGSGKTTLLKIIAGITTPTSGSVIARGKIVSLIDLEAGFHEDLSGIQNIELNGMLLGLSRTYIQTQLRSIISFANIGGFIDVPLYTYSAGMKLRLGFAIAVHTRPDIILLDESMAVGDQEFRHKAEEKIQEFHKQNKTIIMVSHDLSNIYKLCSRVIHLEHGVIKQIESVAR